jgi:glutamate/tyrosine decarboxylase-like PLP-dependent enzyme
MTRPSGDHCERREVLDLDPERFRVLGRELVDRIADLLGSIRERRVTPGERPSEVRRVLRADDPLPEGGVEPGALLDEAATLLLEHSLFNGHPRFFGYITSPPAPLGVLGDLLASAVNANVGAWVLSPMASEIEAQTVRWIAELIGYERTCGGLLVSGGNVANFVCLLAARTAQVGQDVRRRGLHGEPRRLLLYASQETHTWVQKATDLFGLGTDAVRWVPTDGELRMDVDALRSKVEEDSAAGDLPFLVIGTAGSVSTGAVDPLRRIGQVCRDHALWFHVDGAYGGFAAACADVPEDLRALATADSIAIDPHKWLYAPLEAGCVLVRDPAALTGAFSYHPPYYNFGEEAPNYVDYGLQNSRGFRALKVWLQLRQAGRAGYVKAIEEDMRLARVLHALAHEHPELQPMIQGLSITTFRYVPADLRSRLGDAGVEVYLDDLNRAVLDLLERGGEAFVSQAVIRGRLALRACIVNFRTDEADVRALPEIVARLGRASDAELRAGKLGGAVPPRS